MSGKRTGIIELTQAGSGKKIAITVTQQGCDSNAPEYTEYVPGEDKCIGNKVHKKYRCTSNCEGHPEFIYKNTGAGCLYNIKYKMVGEAPSGYSLPADFPIHVNDTLNQLGKCPNLNQVIQGDYIYTPTLSSPQFENFSCYTAIKLDDIQDVEVIVTWDKQPRPSMDIPIIQFDGSNEFSIQNKNDFDSDVLFKWELTGVSKNCFKLNKLISKTVRISCSENSEDLCGGGSIKVTAQRNGESVESQEFSFSYDCNPHWVNTTPLKETCINNKIFVEQEDTNPNTNRGIRNNETARFCDIEYAVDGTTITITNPYNDNWSVSPESCYKLTGTGASRTVECADNVSQSGCAEATVTITRSGSNPVDINIPLACEQTCDKPVPVFEVDTNNGDNHDFPQIEVGETVELPFINVVGAAPITILQSNPSDWGFEVVGLEKLKITANSNNHGSVTLQRENCAGTEERVVGINFANIVNPNDVKEVSIIPVPGCTGYNTEVTSTTVYIHKDADENNPLEWGVWDSPAMINDNIYTGHFLLDKPPYSGKLLAGSESDKANVEGYTVYDKCYNAGTDGMGMSKVVEETCAAPCTDPVPSVDIEFEGGSIESLDVPVGSSKNVQVVVDGENYSLDVATVGDVTANLTGHTVQINNNGTGGGSVTVTATSCSGPSSKTITVMHSVDTCEAYGFVNGHVSKDNSDGNNTVSSNVKMDMTSDVRIKAYVSGSGAPFAAFGNPEVDVLINGSSVKKADLPLGDNYYENEFDYEGLKDGDNIALVLRNVGNAGSILTSDLVFYKEGHEERECRKLNIVFIT